MMETADLWQGYDLAPGGRLDGAWLRRVLAQGQVRSRSVIVGEVGLQDAVQVLLTEDNDVIKAFSTYGSDSLDGLAPSRRRSAHGNAHISSRELGPQR